MNFRDVLFGAAVALCFISCDENTSTLGGSITPDEDKITIIPEFLEAGTASVLSPDSILAKTSTCYLGRYTDPYDSTSFTAGYLTQLNCVEHFDLPDSIFGIGDFKFPARTYNKWKNVEPYYSNLKLFYTDFFGDSLNALKIEIFELDRMIDSNRRYYADADPSEFVDLTKKPLAVQTISPTDFGITDEELNSSNHYANITVRLPQEFTKALLEKYYQPGGRKFFTSSKAFMENVCKGFYIRCTQGDGTVFYIDRSVLEVNHKSIMYVDGEPRDTSLMSDFSGNNEVMQINTFDWKGRERLINQDDCSWIQTPYGILTEVTLPITEIEGKEGSLNSVQVVFNCMPTPSQRFSPTIPGTIGMFRESDAARFFESSDKIDVAKIFMSNYASKTGTYTFNNIAPLIEKIIREKNEWLEANGMKDNASGMAAYESANPSWNKCYLIPMTQRIDGNSSVVGYYLDTRLHRVRISGGSSGEKARIKVIRTSFK